VNIPRTRTLVAGTTVVAAGLVAVPLGLLGASPAHADTERHGSCGRGTYEFDVDREKGGYEVSFDIDGVRTGSTWRVKLVHDGKVVTKKVHRADREGEVEMDRWRPNTKGSDTFKVRTRNTITGASCSATITR
jgi:hypothetical protein